MNWRTALWGAAALWGPLLLSTNACGDGSGVPGGQPDSGAELGADPSTDDPSTDDPGVDPGATSDGHSDGAVTTQLISADEGGTLVSHDGRLRVDIPPFALREDTEISLVGLSTDGVSDTWRDLHAGVIAPHRLDPTGLVLDLPALATFELSDGELFPEGSIIWGVVTTSDQSAPGLSAAGLVDEGDGTTRIRGPLNRLSELAVMAVAQAEIDVECSPCEVGRSWSGTVTVWNRLGLDLALGQSRLTADGTVELANAGGDPHDLRLADAFIEASEPDRSVAFVFSCSGPGPGHLGYLGLMASSFLDFRTAAVFEDVDALEAQRSVDVVCVDEEPPDPGERFNCTAEHQRNPGAVELVYAFEPTLVERAALTDFNGCSVAGQEQHIADHRGQVFIDLGSFLGEPEPNAGVTLVSRNAAGELGDGDSLQATLADSGLRGAFQSNAGDLVAEPTAEGGNVYVFSVGAATGLPEIERVFDPAIGGALEPALSGNGRWLAARHDNLDGSRQRIFLLDLEAGPSSTPVELPPSTEGQEIALSWDGRHVVFSSVNAGLIVEDDGSGDNLGVFAIDRGAPDPDGDFEPGAERIVRISRAPSGKIASGTAYGPAISGDGRYVAFSSDSEDLVEGLTTTDLQVFVHDRDTDGDGTYDEDDAWTTQVASWSVVTDDFGDAPSFSASICDDGRYVAFVSAADNLVSGVSGDPNHHVYVRDRQGDLTALVDRSAEGAPGDDGVGQAFISPDGRTIAFDSQATNLMPAEYADSLLGVFVAPNPLYVAP